MYSITKKINIDRLISQRIFIKNDKVMKNIDDKINKFNGFFVKVGRDLAGKKIQDPVKQNDNDKRRNSKDYNS